MAHPFKHFYTITKHRHKVIAHCFKAGIWCQGLLHDLSKYSPVEFINGAKFYQGTASPNELERRAYGYSLAWMHHQGRNRHHFDYWHDYNPDAGKVIPVAMPDKYVKEMACDRVAACKIYLGDKYNDASALNYFMNHHKKYFIHEETREKLYFLLKLLADKGEEEFFGYMRKNKTIAQEKLPEQE